MRREMRVPRTTERDYSAKIAYWKERLRVECAVQPKAYNPDAAVRALNSLEYFMERQAELEAKKVMQKVG
jgi:hypothetical protein